MFVMVGTIEAGMESGFRTGGLAETSGSFKMEKLMSCLAIVIRGESANSPTDCATITLPTCFLICARWSQTENYRRLIRRRWNAFSMGSTVFGCCRGLAVQMEAVLACRNRNGVLPS